MEITTIPQSQIQQECAFDGFYSDGVRGTALNTNIESGLETTFRNDGFNTEFDLDGLNTYDKVVKILENATLEDGNLVISGMRKTEIARDILYSVIEIKDVLKLPDGDIKNDIINKRLSKIKETLEDFIDNHKEDYQDGLHNNGENEDDLRDYALQIQKDLQLCYSTVKTDNGDDLLKNEDMNNGFSNEVDAIKNNATEQLRNIRIELMQYLRDNTSLTERKIENIFKT